MRRGPIWDSAVSALRSLGNSGPQIMQAIEAAKASGGTLRPEVEQAYEAWLTAAERLKQRVAQIIESSPEIVAALDTTGPQQTAVAGFLSGLEAYLGELSSSSSEILELLKSPILQKAGGVQGYGFGQFGPAIGWAARFAGPAWAKLIELLGLPLVRSAVVTTLTVKGIGDALNADTNAYVSLNDSLNQLVAEGKLTAEQAFQLKEQKPAGLGAMVVLGVVGLGGLALYLANKKKHP